MSYARSFARNSKERELEDRKEDYVIDERELLMMWKIKCLDIFEVPPPLFRRGGREVRSDE
jgi:hypothetical protein